MIYNDLNNLRIIQNYLEETSTHPNGLKGLSETQINDFLKDLYDFSVILKGIIEREQ